MLIFLDQEIAASAFADRCTFLYRPAADRVVFPEFSGGGDQEQARAFLHQDISGGIFSKAPDILPEVDLVQQGIIILIVYLTLKIIAH